MAATPASTRPRLLESMLLAYARGFPLRRGKLRLVNALWRAALGADHRRQAELRSGGFRMSCDVREALQRQFYFFGTYFLETELLDCWAAAARGAQVIFDVGANAGIYGLEAIAANPAAIVHAFEPTPEIARRLSETAHLNGLQNQLLVHETAVSDADGEAVLRRWRGADDDNEGMNFVVRPRPGSNGEKVRTVRLDHFCEERGLRRIDLLKLDIQGHEPAALKGAGELIDQHRIGVIFMELNWGEGADCPASSSIACLEAAGYRFSPPGPRLQFLPPGDWLRRYSDVLACAPDFKGEA